MSPSLYFSDGTGTSREVTVLFPVRIDDAVMDCSEAWAITLWREWHIGDFREWKQHDACGKRFERLLRNLKAG